MRSWSDPEGKAITLEGVKGVQQEGSAELGVQECREGWNPRFPLPFIFQLTLTSWLSALSTLGAA